MTDYVRTDRAITVGMERIEWRQQLRFMKLSRSRLDLARRFLPLRPTPHYKRGIERRAR